MKNSLILITIFLTMFLDMFNLGLIYPVFTSLIFEGSGGLVLIDSSDFYKNAIFGLLISLFPFGQFLGAPIIGQLSDIYGRRKLLISTLLGTVVTLLICAFGVFFTSLSILLAGRFIGGLMAGNMTLAYASLADFSSQKNKVKNFALIPLATGLGFACGPYVAGQLADPYFFHGAGPTAAFLFASFLAVINFGMAIWKFPETAQIRKKTKIGFSNFVKIGKALKDPLLRPYLLILFLMLSSNLVFVQFVGPFAIDRFSIGVTQVGYLYANIGIAVALGHLFLTRRLADYLASEKALIWSLFFLAGMLTALVLSQNIFLLHIITFAIMLACAVAYTNSMALVSNQAPKDQQGEIMGIAVSIQSCSEFLPAVLLGLVASISQAIPLLTSAFCAIGAVFLLVPLIQKEFLNQSN